MHSYKWSWLTVVQLSIGHGVKNRDAEGYIWIDWVIYFSQSVYQYTKTLKKFNYWGILST